MTAGAPDGSLFTDEQQQGRAAEAVKELHGELVQRYTSISGAEDKLSQVLLEAHATTSDGRAKLQEAAKSCR